MQKQRKKSKIYIFPFDAECTHLQILLILGQCFHIIAFILFIFATVPSSYHFLKVHIQCFAWLTNLI